MKTGFFRQLRDAGSRTFLDFDAAWRESGVRGFLKSGHFMRRIGAELVYAFDEYAQDDDRAEAARADIQSVLDAYRLPGTMAEIGTYYSLKTHELRKQRGAHDADADFRPTDLHWVRVNYRGLADGSAYVSDLLVHSEDGAPRYGYSAHHQQHPSNLYSVFFVPFYNRWALGRSLRTDVSRTHTLADETWQLVLAAFERFAEGESMPCRIEGLSGQNAPLFYQEAWNLAPDAKTDRQRARQLIGCIAQHFKNRPGVHEAPSTILSAS